MEADDDIPPLIGKNMFWKHRVDLREVIQPINKLSERELKKRLPQIVEAIADKLENASVFRKSAFPQKIRSIVKATELKTVLEEVYDFAMDEKVWIGVEREIECDSGTGSDSGLGV